MIRFLDVLHRLTRSLLVVTAGVLLWAFGLSSCSKHPTRIDPGYVPEGVFTSDAQMVLWYDAPNTIYRYRDGPPPGPNIGDLSCPVIAPGDSDVLIDSSEVRRYDPGTVVGMIFDATGATSYQVFRREEGGGFHALNDFSLPPEKRFPQSEWELYKFIDGAPSTYPVPSYMGRGVVAGAITRSSPLTPVGELASIPVANILYTGLICPRDSLFTLQWVAVPGADRYWMQVYTLRQAPASEEMLSGAPAPLYDGLTHDFLIAYLEGSNTSYKLGDTTRTDVKVLLRRQTLFNAAYSVRISALDANGQLIACTRGDYAVRRSESGYSLYRLGAVIVAPARGR